VRALSQLVIAVVELAEAEGRDLRAALRGEAARARSAFLHAAAAVAVLFVTVPLIVGGLWLMAMGLVAFLEVRLGEPLALMTSGGVVVLVGVGCLLKFRSMERSARAG
jgi:hypothetical protein